MKRNQVVIKQILGHKEAAVWIIDILPGLKALGFLPSRSSSAGLYLTGCCYFGSSLMLTDLSVMAYASIFLPRRDVACNVPTARFSFNS